MKFIFDTCWTFGVIFTYKGHGQSHLSTSTNSLLDWLKQCIINNYFSVIQLIVSYWMILHYIIIKKAIKILRKTVQNIVNTTKCFKFSTVQIFQNTLGTRSSKLQKLKNLQKRETFKNWNILKTTILFKTSKLLCSCVPSS